MTLFERIRRAIQSNKARMDDLRTNNRSLVDRNIETTNTIQRLDQEKSKLLSEAVTMKKNFQTAVQRIAYLEEVVAGYEKAALENTGQSLDEGLEILRQELGLPETDPDAVVGEVVERPATTLDEVVAAAAVQEEVPSDEPVRQHLTPEQVEAMSVRVEEEVSDTGGKPEPTH